MCGLVRVCCVVSSQTPKCLFHLPKCSTYLPAAHVAAMKDDEYDFVREGKGKGGARVRYRWGAIITEGARFHRQFWAESDLQP